MSPRRVTACSHEGAFTLLELLVAMALLASLGTLLVSLVQNTLDMLSHGDRRADLYQKGLDVLDLLEQDLVAVHGGPEGRLLLFQPGQQGGEPGSRFLLRLVRSIPGGEQQHRYLRDAGTSPGADQTYEGSDPGIKQRGALAPPSGLLEVAYALVHEKEDPEGMLTLYRGEHAPALEPKGFFDEGAAGGFDEQWIHQHLKPVAGGILGLWVLFFSQESHDWLEEDVMDGHRAAGGSTLVWDSTRGLLPRSLFPLARGPASLGDARDDIFPKRVRLVVQVARSHQPEAVVQRAFQPGDQKLLLNSTSRLPPEGGLAPIYYKLRGEWLREESRSSGSLTVRRHVRQSSPVNVAVPVGTPLFSGRLFRMSFALPAHRSVWKGRGG